MKKKNLLAMAVLLSVLQGSSCFAGNQVESKSIITHDKFFATNSQSINVNKEDIEYNFQKGASFAVENSDSYVPYCPIMNKTEHSLTINVGGDLDEFGERYKFDLKPNRTATIYIAGPGSNNSIALKNTNMNIGVCEDGSGLNVKTMYSNINKTFLNITMENSDININNINNEEDSRAAMYVENGGTLNITGKGQSDINIIGNFIRGIETDQAENSGEQTAFNIQGINDLNIKLDTKLGLETYGIIAKNKKFNINAEGNIYIGSTSPDKDIACGLLIEPRRFNVDFDIAAKGNFVIDNATVGIYARPTGYVSGGDIGKTDINITANSVYINANRKDSIKKLGLGIFIQGSHGKGRAFDNIINSKGEDGINIDAEGTGILVENGVTSKVHSKFIAENGGINISSGTTGIHLVSIEGASDCINTKIEADKDINIYAKNDGIESVIKNGSLNINSNEGNINIVAERDALKSGHVWYSKDLYDDGFVNSSIGLATGKILTNITAEKNVSLSGKETGIKYATVNSAEADIKSNSGNVFVFGEMNGIYLDSQSIDKNFYEGIGNLGKHDIDIKAEIGSVYIGSFGKNGSMSAGGNGVLNNGKSQLNVEAGELVEIQGDKTALTTQKQGDNVIKGKKIVLNSNGIGLKSEGVNSIIIGYKKEDNKLTDSVSISGNIGVDLKANNLGKYDVKNNKDNQNIRINRDNNVTVVKSNNIDIYGSKYGLNVSQEATAKGSDNQADIYTVWKNNIVDIHANGNVNIFSDMGTAINVDGINKVNIKNIGNNTIKGKKQGVNLMLDSKLVKENIDYKKQMDDYINKKTSDYIRVDSEINESDWNKTYREVCENNYNTILVQGTKYTSFAAYYKDLLYGENSKALQQDIKNKLGVAIKPEQLKIMQEKYNDDPVKGMLFLIIGKNTHPSILDSTLKEEFAKLDKKTAEVVIESYLKELNLATLKDYFDKLVAEGKFEAINYNIDVKDEFNLETKGTNTILGGVNAFNIDGKLHALVKGDVNYFSSSNYREDDFDDKRQSSVAVNIVNKGDFRSEGNTNIVKAGKIDKGFGNETAVKVQDGGKAVFVAKDGGNRLSGAAFVGNAGYLEITSNGGNNTILSSTHGSNETENGVNVVNAVFASGKDSAIKIDAGSTGVNNIATDVQFASANQDGREITVWAHDGAGVNINGAVNISASNGANYVNAAKGNALGVAVSAGGRALQYDDTALKPIDNISKVDINYTSGVKDSFISGDIVAGYGGQVDIHRDKAKDNSLAVNGNILAANNGVTNVDFGNGGSWIGRADDYFAADKKGEVDFFAPAFSNAIKEEGKVNVTMNNGMWSVTGQSWLTSFEGGNNTIDMVNFNARDNSKNLANAVAIRTMNGENNKFIMSLDNVNRHDSDMLYIKDGNATINVEVNGTINGLENVSQENGLRFATVCEGINLNKIAYQEDGKAFVRGKNGGFFNAKLFVERQDYAKDNQYNTEFNGGEELNAEKPGNAGVEDLFGQDIDKADNLVIVKVEREDMSDAGSTVLDLSKVNYSNAVYMDRFNKRMGEARFIDGDEGIWVRMRHDRIGKDNAFRSNNTMYEIGYDAKQLKEDGEHRVGFAMDYMDGSSSFSKVSGSGEVNRKGLWMYDSWIGEKGHYRDLVAKWGHLSNDFEFMSGAGETTGEFGNNVYSVSAEFGKKNDIGNNWYFEPQAQLQYAHVTGSDYVTTMDGADQTQIRNDAFNSLIARAGFRIGKDVDARSTVYLKADVMHEFLGEQDVFANDGTTSGEWAKASYDHGGTWYDLGFGYSTKLNEASYVYIDVETSFGNDYEKTYQINGGVQWSF